MGNKPSTPEVVPVVDKEMDKCQRYENLPNDRHDSLLGADQLLEMCEKLQENVDAISKAIGDMVFEDSNLMDVELRSEVLGIRKKDSSTSRDENVSQRDVEQRINERARCIRNLIRALTSQLDRHARLVGSIDNVRLMELVKLVVGSVNTYVTMLMRFIRKLRRLLAEKGDGNGSGMMSNNMNKKEILAIDVIQDSQDADAMLVELSRTEKEREELVNDAITVLVIYRDYKCLGDIGKDDIDENVRMAAESIVHGLDLQLGSHTHTRHSNKR